LNIASSKINNGTKAIKMQKVRGVSQATLSNNALEIARI
jgi:hypothetical protein